MDFSDLHNESALNFSKMAYSCTSSEASLVVLLVNLLTEVKQSSVKKEEALLIFYFS